MSKEPYWEPNLPAWVSKPTSSWDKFIIGNHVKFWFLDPKNKTRQWPSSMDITYEVLDKLGDIDPKKWRDWETKRPPLEWPFVRTAYDEVRKLRKTFEEPKKTSTPTKNKTTDKTMDAGPRTSSGRASPLKL